MDWKTTLYALAIAFAVGGGMLGLTAFFRKRRLPESEIHARQIHVLYLASYILMSLSIFFVSFRALI